MGAAKLLSELASFWPEQQVDGPDVAIRKVQICSPEAEQKVRQGFDVRQLYCLKIPNSQADPPAESSAAQKTRGQ